MKGLQWVEKWVEKLKQAAEVLSSSLRSPAAASSSPAAPQTLDPQALHLVINH